MDININFNNFNQSIKIANSTSTISGIEDSDCIFSYSDSSNTSADGIIGNSYQSKKTGDCWLLSAINSLNSSDKGQQILENAITKNDDGSYSIYFRGVNQSVRITQEEISAAKETGDYSTGDEDVLLLELGFKDIIQKIQNKEIKVNGYHPYVTFWGKDTEENAINGGSFQDAIFLLTGNNSFHCTNPKKYDNLFDRQENDSNFMAAIIEFGENGNHAGETIKDINGNDIFTIPSNKNHNFSIKSVNGDNIVIVNPWDSSIEYTVSRDTIKEYANCIDFYLY